ncbi:hypothetical protein ACH4TX_44460 [Streptomyces sp. NPDC021098]|uniref:hypothetical protein n=1 Tax=unclassified Streptomyces TaxID=2593676 RepID=UPI0037B801CC
MARPAHEPRPFSLRRGPFRLVRIAVHALDASHAMLLERPRALAGLVRSFTTGLGLRS